MFCGLYTHFCGLFQNQCLCFLKMCFFPKTMFVFLLTWEHHFLSLNKATFMSKCENTWFHSSFLNQMWIKRMPMWVATKIRWCLKLVFQKQGLQKKQRANNNSRHMLNKKRRTSSRTFTKNAHNLESTNILKHDSKNSQIKKVFEMIIIPHDQTNAN